MKPSSSSGFPNENRPATPVATSAASDGEARSALDWLAAQFPDSPRKRIKEWFEQGRVRLDDTPFTRMQEQMPDPGQRLKLADRAAAAGITASNLYLPKKLRIVFIDDNLAIINKPAGLLSVPTSDRKGDSALDLLQQYLDRGRTARRTALPVHRLDEYTSGLMCCALTPAARAHLVNQVKTHQLERTYLAYVDGRPPARSGTWDHAMLLDDDGLHQSIVAPDCPGASRAVTHFEVVKSYTLDSGRQHPPRTITKLRLRLQTGLRHQIRIQAAHEGLPLLGDRLYHPDFSKSADCTTTDKRPRRSTGGPSRHSVHPDRQALHAVRLGLIHPATGQYQFWQANLPRDLAELDHRFAMA